MNEMESLKWLAEPLALGEAPFMAFHRGSFGYLLFFRLLDMILDLVLKFVDHNKCKR